MYYILNEMEALNPYEGPLTYTAFTDYIKKTYGFDQIQITKLGCDGDINTFNFPVEADLVLQVYGSNTRKRKLSHQSASSASSPSPLVRSLSVHPPQYYQSAFPARAAKYIIDPNYANVQIPGFTARELNELSCIFDTGNAAKTLISDAFANRLEALQTVHPDVISIKDTIPQGTNIERLEMILRGLNRRFPDLPPLKETLPDMDKIREKAHANTLNNYRKGDMVTYENKKAVVLLVKKNTVTLLFFTSKTTKMVDTKECKFDPTYLQKIRVEFMDIPGMARKFRCFTSETIYNLLHGSSAYDIRPFLERMPADDRGSITNAINTLLHLKTFSGVVKDASFVSGFKTYGFNFTVEGIQENVPYGLYIEAYRQPSDTDILFNATTIRTLALFNVIVSVDRNTVKQHSEINGLQQDLSMDIALYQVARILNDHRSIAVLSDTIHLRQSTHISLLEKKINAVRA